jgi:ribosome recycling factor
MVYLCFTHKKTKAMFDVNSCLSEAEELMEMAILHLEDEFAHIRAGKANIRILDDIRVDSYGSMVALNNVAALSTPDARTIAIRPWDKNMIKVIEKAIIDSAVGIMPTNNGEIIRLAIPPLTEERRRDLVKQSGKVNESSKISIRNARRDTLDALKKAQKEGLPEDAEKDAEEKLQKLHDKYIKKADELFADKEKEIMTV